MTSPQRKFQLRAKAAGKCERCGHDKDSARSRVFCERCRVYRNDQQNRYRARRSAVRRMTLIAEIADAYNRLRSQLTMLLPPPPVATHQHPKKPKL